MSFIGSDGIERQLKLLKQQLCDKDAQLTSMHNEQRKKMELVEEARKAKAHAEYRMQEEAERASRAESALQNKNSEMARMKIQLDNMESSLRNATDKAKIGDKAQKQLQYEIDFMSAGDTTGATQRLENEKAALKKQVGDLEGALRRAEKEKLATTRFQTASPSTSRSRRRASSTGATSRIQELEAEITALRQTTDSSAELQTLKTQLASAKREQDRAENSKIAVEKQLQKEMAALKGQLEDMRDEVEWYRSNSDGAGKAELEKIKKAAEREREEMLRRFDESQRVMREKAEEVDHLRSRVQELSVLEQELEEERLARQQAERSASASPSIDESKYAEEILALNKHVASLETDLSEARSQPKTSASNAPTNDRQLRQLQRDLKAAQAQKESLEASLQESDDLLAEKEEEVRRLRCGIPLPASPTLSPRVLQEGELEELQSLRVKTEELTDEVERLGGTKDRLVAAEEELELAKEELVEEKGRFDRFKGEMKAFTSQRTALDVELKDLRSELSAKSDRIIELDAEVTLLSEKVDIERAKADALRVQLQRAEAASEEATRALQETSQLRVELASRAHTDSEFDELSRLLAEREVTLDRTTKELDMLTFREEQDKMALHTELEGLRVGKEDMEGKLLDALRIADEAGHAAEKRISELAEERTQFQADISALRIQLEDHVADLSKQIAITEDITARYEESAADVIRLEATVAELQDGMANRSTESDARSKDEELFQLKEDLGLMSKQLKSARDQIRELGLAHGDAIRQVSELDLQIARSTALPPSPSHRKQESNDRREVARLEAKIGQLRHERDDLRSQLSFVQHENKFALLSVRGERDSATSEMQRVRGEVGKMNRLVGEMKGTSEVLIKGLEERGMEEKEASERTIRALEDEKEQLLKQVKEGHEALKEKTEEDAKWIEHILHEKAKAQGELSKAQQEVYGLRASVAQLEKRVDDLKMRLEDGGTSPGEKVDSEGIQEARSRTSSRVSRHSRTRSELPVMGIDEAMADKADMVKRVQRRDQMIESLKREVQRLQLKLSANDMTEEVEQLAQEKEELNEVLRQRMQELGEMESDLKASRSAIVKRDERIAGLEQGERSLILAMLMQRGVVAEANEKWEVARRGLLRAKEAIVRLEGEVVALDDARKEVTRLEAKVSDLEVARTATEAELSVSREQSTKASAEVADIRAALEDALIASTGTDRLNARVSALEQQLGEANTRATAAEGEAGALLERLANQEALDEAAKREGLETRCKELEESVKSMEVEVQELLAALAEVEKARDDVELRGEGVRMEMEEMERRMTSDLSETRKRLEELQMEIGEVMKGKEAIEAERQDDLEAHRKEMADAVATVKKETMRAEESARTATSQSAEIDALVKRVDELEADAKATEQARSEVEGALSEAKEKEAALRGDLQSARNGQEEMARRFGESRAELALAKEDAQEALQVKAKISELEVQLREKSEMVSLHVADAQKSSETVLALKEELAAVRREISLRDEALTSAQLDISRLTRETEFRLAAAPSTCAESQELVDLQDRVQELEASLTRKVQEVDEADDRVREMYKENAKLGKKISKLQRQVASMTPVDKELAANTAANRAIASLPPSTASTILMPPPPIPAAAAIKAPTPQRQPLKAVVNVFDASPRSAGIKRHREEEDGKPAGLEHIMLPPSFSSASLGTKKAGAGRTVFAAQRSNAFAPTSKSGGNVFAGDLGAGLKETKGNVFAKAGAGDGVQKPHRVLVFSPDV